MIKGHGRSRKVKEGHRWSFSITGLTFQVSPSHSPSPFPLDFEFFIMDLDLGLGFGTGLGLDNKKKE